MSKRLNVRALAIAASALSAAALAQDRMVGTSEPVRFPGTAYEIALGARQPPRMPVEPALLSALMAWLSSGYDLPAAAAPALAFVPAKAMTTLRSASAAASSRVSHDGAVAPGGSGDLVAFYDDEERIIYLPLGWTGETPIELSMLVHELVHHLQNASGVRFGCPEAREKLAYAAQQDWLALFGLDFFEAFETDPFSLLVRTECAP